LNGDSDPYALERPGLPGETLLQKGCAPAPRPKPLRILACWVALLRDLAPRQLLNIQKLLGGEARGGRFFQEGGSPNSCCCDRNLVSRASVVDLILHLHPRLVPERTARFRYTWCLGGLALWTFLIEVLSGALLMLHYVPSAAEAYVSVLGITHVVEYGFFVRNLHYWCGQAMVVLVVLHMVRVFVTRSYAPPRSLNWLIGLSLLVGTLLVDFTGYLLVWDDRALWAYTIARNLTTEVPVIGDFLALVLFGSSEGSDTTLARLYTWHVILLPLLIGSLCGWHFWRIRKDGGISTPL
jgi:quinol-cytochrome oxidoreductase complex cytochrome b subunit